MPLISKCIFVQIIMMKNLLFCFLALVMLSSCTQVYFDKYPGARIAEFPDDYLGTYRLIITGNAEIDTSLLVITKAGFVGTEEGAPKESFFTDSNFLVQYKQDYFLVSKDEIGYMCIRLVKKDKDVLFYLPTVEGEGDEALKAAREFFKGVKKVKKGEEEVLLAKFSEKEFEAFFNAKKESDSFKLEFIKK